MLDEKLDELKEINVFEKEDIVEDASQGIEIEDKEDDIIKDIKEEVILEEPSEISLLKEEIASLRNKYEGILNKLDMFIENGGALIDPINNNNTNELVEDHFGEQVDIFEDTEELDLRINKWD